MFHPPDQWDCAYQTDPDTKMLIERLSIKSPLDERTILKLPVACRTPITRGLLGLVEDRLVYYELIPTVTKHICRIIVPTSLCPTILI